MIVVANRRHLQLKLSHKCAAYLFVVCETQRRQQAASRRFSVNQRYHSGEAGPFLSKRGSSIVKNGSRQTIFTYSWCNDSFLFYYQPGISCSTSYRGKLHTKSIIDNSIRITISLRRPSCVGALARNAARSRQYVGHSNRRKCILCG